MAQNLDRLIGNRAFVGRASTTSGSRTNFAIDSAYVHNTSGDAVGFRYTCGSTDTIDEVYVFVDAFQNRASVGMTCYIYNANTVARPGTTLHATSTATVIPSGDDMWVKFTFGTPYDPAIGEIVWIIVTNSSGAPTTDYPQVLTATTLIPGEQNIQASGWGQIIPHTNTAGFSTSGTVVQEAPIVIKQGSAYYGQPWTQLNTAYYTNNTLERGIRVTCTEDCTVVGAQFIGVAAYDKFRITLAATIPGAAVGAGEVEYDLDASGADDVNGCIIFDTAFTLSGGTAYNVTVTYAANSQLPHVMELQDHTSYSTMFNTLRGYDTISMPWGIISDGGGTPAWTEDKAICPDIQLIISDYPAQAAGGGLLAHPGMRGGFV